MAIGEERSDSDVDFMVVGDVSSAELALALRSAREALGREINPTVYSPAEFARKHKENDGFLARVMAKPSLLVLRNKNDLGETTSQP